MFIILYSHSDYGSDSSSENIYGTGGIYSEARFTNILHVVLQQEKQIQDQFQRIKQADAQIEGIEFRMHNAR